jgi:hypothetical protein
VSSEPRYAVKFVGYAAFVIARKRHREIDYAYMDFVTGMSSIRADGGWVTALNRIDLGAFVKTLPELANELRERLRQGAALAQASVGSSPQTRPDDDLVRLSHGQNEVYVAPGTDVSRFIRQISKRFTEIEPVLEQAEQVGSRIKRRPYSEYIDEIGRTGLARVECHGFGLFLNGRLIFHPDYQVAFAKPAGSNIVEVHSLESENGQNLQQN